MSKTLTKKVDLQEQVNRLTREVAHLKTQIKSNTTTPRKVWYRPSEVCQLLGISRSKFETYKRSGLFPIRKVGGSVYVSYADISRLFADKKAS